MPESTIRSIAVAQDPKLPTLDQHCDEIFRAGGAIARRLDEATKQIKTHHDLWAYDRDLLRAAADLQVLAAQNIEWRQRSDEQLNVNN